MRLCNLKIIRLNTLLSAGRVAQTISLRQPDSGRVIKLVLLALLWIVTLVSAPYAGVTIQSGRSVNRHLPPENGTGNCVKGVQRGPVRIDFDRTAGRLKPGLSAEPEVSVR